MIQAFSGSLGGNCDVLAATTRPNDVPGLIRGGASVVNVAARRTRVQAGAGAGGSLTERRLEQSDLPYPDDMFDGLWINMPDISAEWRDLPRYVRVLAPGGLLALVPPENSGSAGDQDGPVWRRLRHLGFRPADRPDGRTAEGVTLATKQPGASPPGDDCALCPRLRFRLNRLEALPGAGGVLWGDEHFFVMPDLAPLDEGHLLIATADHALAMGSCSSELLDHLETYLRRVRDLFGTVYGCDAVFFEHGPSAPGEAGSCVDHAHMHCLPMRGGVLGLLAREGYAVTPASLAGLAAHHKAGESYLFVQEGEDRFVCTAVQKPPNQLMRSLYASSLDGRAWRWQETYMRADSQDRFMAGLNALLPVVDAWSGGSNGHDHRC